MLAKPDKNKLRKVRHLRVRRKLHGTPERPRLNVYRSLKHIYVQIIDDAVGNTMVAASSLEPEIRNAVAGKKKCEVAKMVGQAAAKKALAKNIKSVVFDRGGYLYTGRVAEVAAGAREGGLEF